MRFPAAAALALAVAAPAAGAPAAAADDARFDARWESLKAGGYEPLTIPLDWYDTTARVAGAAIPVATESGATAGISPAALAAAAAWAEAQNSTALIVARDGRVVLERYWQGTGRDTRFNPQSVAKTVLALLVGTAIAKGEIGSVDDPVGRYLKEWRGDARGDIPLRALLRMAAGLEQGDAGFGYTVSPNNPVVRHNLGSDFTRLPLALARTGPPDTAFDYNSQVNQLLGIVLERASAMRFPNWSPSGCGGHWGWPTRRCRSTGPAAWQRPAAASSRARSTGCGSGSCSSMAGAMAPGRWCPANGSRR